MTSLFISSSNIDLKTKNLKKDLINIYFLVFISIVPVKKTV